MFLLCLKVKLKVCSLPSRGNLLGTTPMKDASTRVTASITGLQAVCSKLTNPSNSTSKPLTATTSPLHPSSTTSPTTICTNKCNPGTSFKNLILDLFQKVKNTELVIPNHVLNLFQYCFGISKSCLFSTIKS